jgi:hypothetical protein
MKHARRQFGYVRKLPSGRIQASYVGPDLIRHAAPFTFDTKLDAEAWLTDERRIIGSGNWIAPKRRREAREALLPPTLADYAAGWLKSRTLRDRTRHHYQQMLDRQLNDFKSSQAHDDYAYRGTELVHGARPGDTGAQGAGVLAAKDDSQ